MSRRKLKSRKDPSLVGCITCGEPALYRPFIHFPLLGSPEPPTRAAISPRVGMCVRHLSFDFSPLVEELRRDPRPFSDKMPNLEALEFCYALATGEKGASFKAQIDGTLLCFYCAEQATHFPALFIYRNGNPLQYTALELKPCCPDHRGAFDFAGRKEELLSGKGELLMNAKRILGGLPDLTRTEFAYLPCANGHREFICDGLGHPL